MKKAKQILSNFPEYYLMALAILGWYTPPFSFNPIFIGLAAILLLQIIVKNKVTGIVIGMLIMVINLFMLGAIISEFREFTVFNGPAKQLLFVGVSLWVINMTASVMMIYKNSINNLIDDSYNGMQPGTLE